MKVLVTRAAEDAAALAAALGALGHEAAIEPLISFEPLDEAPIPAGDFQALLATSRQAIRALARRQADVQRLEAVPLLAVGVATATAATNAGFRSVRPAAGDAAALVSEVVVSLDPAAGPLLQLAGEDLAADIAGELRAAGFRVATATIYRMRAASALSAQTHRDVAAGHIDAVLLMSPRTARIWVACIEAAGLSAEARCIRHLCLSPAVAAVLSRLLPACVWTAPKPTLDALLGLLTD